MRVYKARELMNMDLDEITSRTLKEITIEFEDGVTAAFSMEAFTPWGGRRTRVMGSMGFIEGVLGKEAISSKISLATLGSIPLATAPTHSTDPSSRFLP